METVVCFVWILFSYITLSKGVDVRLVAGNGRGDGILSGRIEIRRFSHHVYGSLSIYNGFGYEEAAVICKQLGYTTGTPRYDAYFGKSDTKAVKGFVCVGQESSVSECEITWQYGRYSQYDHLKDIGVECGQSTALLINDNKMTSSGNLGAVMVWEVGWTTVCDDNWNDELAKVACLSMGYVDGRSLCCSKLTFLTKELDSKYSSKFQRFDGSCPANTTNLQNCPGNITTTACETQKIASVICYDTDLDTVNNSFAVRFVNSSNDYGLLEVRRYGQWGLINGDKYAGWTQDAADIACKSAGYTGGITYYKRSNGRPIKFFWITELNCTGTETSLDECVTEWGEPVSKYVKAAEAICYKTERPTISLVNGTSSYGLVQISVDGVQGTICSSSSNTADTICRQLGYGHGVAVPTGYFGKGTGEIYTKINYCLKDSIWDCEYDYDWGDVEYETCLDHSKDLAVYCHFNVRILEGDYSAGVVSVFRDNRWYLLCPNALKQTEATVICKELQYDDGYMLQPGSFGTYDRSYNEVGFTQGSYHCLGNEISFTKCSLNEDNTCLTSDFTDYSAIKCYKGSLNTDQSLKLVGSRYANVGFVSITKNEFTGGVCFDNFKTQDVQVVCRHLGYTGGYATNYLTSNTVFAIQDLNCAGNENSLFDCPVGIARCRPKQYNKASASVFCYNNTAPLLRFENGGSSGFLELVVGDEVGSVCVKQVGTTQPTTICKLMGYKTGEYDISRTDTRNSLPVFLNNVHCTEADDNILKCSSDFWRLSDTATSCPGTSVAIECYHNVRLRPESTNGIALSGYIQMHKEFNSREWTPICGGIDDNVAKVICRELKAPYYQRLADDVYLKWVYLHGFEQINCTGMESTIFDCSYHKLYLPCGSSSSILCSTTPIQPTITVDGSRHNGYYSVHVALPNTSITGPMCIDGWTDNAAMVLCKQEHYLTGYKMLLSNNKDPPTVGKGIMCTGNESNLNECRLTVGIQCANNNSDYVGGAICTNSTQGFEIRLKSGSYSRNWGLVEVAFEGVWGTVNADSQYTYEAAHVACKQLGFSTGYPATGLKYTRHDGPTWLYGISSCGIEQELWKCQLAGFNTTTRHVPLLVKCRPSVSLSVSDTVGHVVWSSNNTKNLICSEGFTEKEATVVCRQLGYLYGYKLNQDYASPPHYYNISYYNLQCTGLETRIEDCTADYQDACIGNATAEVICSDDGDDTDYKASFDSNVKKVFLNHMGIRGSICADNWTDVTASVVCKEVNGKTDIGGIAYKYYNSYTIKNNIEERFKWKSNVQCFGNETYLSQCPYTSWQQTNCPSQHVAAVYCYSKPGFDMRLVGGSEGSGRVEALVDGEWGIVCGSIFSYKAANVVCHMLNYTGGHTLPYGTYGQASGQKIMMTFVKCTGEEMSILECTLNLRPKYYYCPVEQQAVIQCTGNSDVRLSSSSPSRLGNYGRLEIYKEEEWYPVCDANFTDDLARLACRELNYKDGIYRCCSPLGSVNKTFVTITACDPNNVHSITGCTNNKGCSSGQYVTIYCSHNTLDSDMQSNSISHGKVEVNLGGDRMVVCRTNWTDQEANVLCKSNGYDGVPYVSLNYTDDTGENVGPALVTIDEVTHNICAYGWGSNNAQVFCRGLGYIYGESIIYTRDVENEQMFISTCKGDETSLFLCEYYLSTCRRAAGARCYNKRPAVRLSSGSYYGNYGRLEIHKEEEWYPVCDDDFTDDLARLACRELNFQDGVYRCCSPLGSVNKTFVTNTACDPNSVTSITDCTDNKGCSSGQYVTIYCSYNTDGMIVSITNSQLAITLGGERVAVCITNWTDREANVACKSQGYDGGIAQYDVNPLLPIVFGNFNCVGTETGLTQCSKDIHNTGCLDSESLNQLMAGVICYNNGQVPYVSLNSTEEVGIEGYALVTIDGATDNICGYTWENDSAQVFCRELGYTNGSAIILSEEVIMTRRLYQKCKGDEKSLFVCRFINYSNLCPPAAARCYTEETQITHTTSDSVTQVTSDFVTQGTSGFVTQSTSGFVTQGTSGFVNQTTQSSFTTKSSPRDELTTTDGVLSDTDKQSGLNDQDVIIITSSVLGAVIVCLVVLVVVLIRRFVVKA